MVEAEARSGPAGALQTMVAKDRPMIVSAPMRKAMRSGAIAGLVAGVVTALLGLVRGALAGDDLWVLTKMPAIPFLGDDARRSGFDLVPLLLGGAIHLAVSIGWGLLFGVLARGHRVATTIGLGALWGVVVWLVMFQVVLPITQSRGVEGTLGEHIVFGVVVALAYLPGQPRSLSRA
jgi:hypothetical protein